MMDIQSPARMDINFELNCTANEISIYQQNAVLRFEILHKAIGTRHFCMDIKTRKS